MQNILIVDDHPVLRRGLAALIRSDLRLEVSGEADNHRDAMAQIELCQPDAVIVDIMLNRSDGLDLIKDLRSRFPSIPALVLSMHDETVYAERALKAGAKGYLTKKQLDDTILDALHTILSGETFLSDSLKSSLAAKYISGQTAESASSIENLSNRELQVFRQVGRGRATRQIAERFNLSIKTVESHLEHIKQKLTLGSAAELAQAATRWVETGRTH
ncbi:MAG: response regulator [Gammaproteobacteria bacterium]